MRAIHQFLAGFTSGDAISNEAVEFRTVFREWGYTSEIFSEGKRILPELRKQARDVGTHTRAIKPDDVVLLHLSVGSTVNDCFAHLPCRKVILYHNVTPSQYFELINKETANYLAWGRRQLRDLAGTADITLADSRFNADELERAGYRDVKVLPLLLDIDRLAAQQDRSVIKKYGDGKCNVLFVGRCAPNKKLEDAITAFFYFHKFVEPHSRFIHVGSFAGTERYYHLLLTQIRELGLSSVHFAGAVPQPQLNAYYACADLFLCMSEHEGFCIPLIEGMAHHVPILAYAAGAVPETLDGAGTLIREKDFAFIAELMGRLHRDRSLRAAVLEQQEQRLSRYRQRDLAEELRTHLAPLLAPTS